MRVAVILLLAVLFPAPSRSEANDAASSAVETTNGSAETEYSPMTSGEKFRFSLRNSFGAASILGSAFSAGYNQAVDSIPEWGQGMEGYGKRFSSSMGQKAIEKTTCSSLKILLREDPRYFRSNKQGFRTRTLYAIGETFVAHKDSGGTRPNYSYFTGVATGVYISRQWRPENYRTASEYVQGAAVSVGVYAAKNIFMEFLPDVRKKVFKNRLR